MDIKRAKEIVRSLAHGVDPTTGEVFDEDSAYNRPEVIRALFVLLEAVPDGRVQPRNAGKPWSEIEDNKLQDEFASELKISDIAKEHGRTRGAIESRLDYLDMKKSPFWELKRKSRK